MTEPEKADLVTWFGVGLVDNGATVRVTDPMPNRQTARNAIEATHAEDTEVLTATDAAAAESKYLELRTTPAQEPPQKDEPEGSNVSTATAKKATSRGPAKAAKKSPAKATAPAKKAPPQRRERQEGDPVLGRNMKFLSRKDLEADQANPPKGKHVYFIATSGMVHAFSDCRSIRQGVVDTWAGPRDSFGVWTALFESFKAGDSYQGPVGRRGVMLRDLCRVCTIRQESAAPTKATPNNNAAKRTA